MLLRLCSLFSIWMSVSMERQWNELHRRTPKYVLWKPLPYCHFLHHKSNTHWPKMVPGPSRCKSNFLNNRNNNSCEYDVSQICTRRGCELRPSLFRDVTQRIPTFWDSLWVPSSRAKQLVWLLKMGRVGCPETSIPCYRCTLCNIPEERRCQQHRVGSLKSRTRCNVWLVRNYTSRCASWLWRYSA